MILIIMVYREYEFESVRVQESISSCKRISQGDRFAWAGVIKV